MFRYYFNYKEIIFMIVFFLIFLFGKIKSDNCIANSFSDLSYAKTITLDNNYKVMLSATGIYSFDPELSDIKYSYDFNEDQEIPENEEANYISNGDISQFSGEDGETKYVLCLIRQIIYVLTENGEVIYYKDISNELSSYASISLVAYKYSNNIYYFILSHIISYSYELRTLHYKIIFKDENVESIVLITDKQERPSYEGISYWSNSINVSCNRMHLSGSIVLSCFFGILDANSPIAVLNYNPDEDFSKVSMSNLVVDPDDKNIKYIKSSINNDRTKILVCYTVDIPKGRCLYYDINENILSNVFINSEYCSSEPYGINVYYFRENNEYIFSCVNGDNKFFMKRIDSDFNIIDDDLFNGKEYSDCSDFTTFSIVYLEELNIYSNIMNANCEGEKHIRFFMLLDDSCQIPEKQKVQTTIPETITTLVTTIPEVFTTIITTIPKTITTIITSIPKIETTIIKTTIPENIPESTNVNIYISSSESKLPETQIISFLLNIQSSIISVETEKTDTDTGKINAETLCHEKGKIYYEGQCICDEKNGYYLINSEYSNNKCYKKNELPKNLYYNNITKSYEICFQACATCLKGGNIIENNCLTCASNYIKEPENYSSNCVDKCKYYYYYDSLNQYTCTEDEQCPNEAGLIVRPKNKCINNCINDNIYKFQFNGECLSSCPINTEANQMNICQINNVAICSSSDFELNLDEVIEQENVKIAAKNYAKEFYYTVNHISKFLSQNFTMVLYKNSSCIEELKLNITKIEYESCIEQVKIDNNINEEKELIVAVIDIANEKNPITSFGFFDPDTGEKLNAAKSCSDKNVMMYENILSILNEPFALQLLTEQKINIFNLNDSFYKDICFHYDSPNGKDATLQDRIKTFYPNVTLCDINCNNVNINFTTMKAECQCTFQDLLSNNIFQNDILGNNVFIKEALEEVTDMINNMNIEILKCYKDVFDFKYIKKNLGGFTIIALFISESVSFLFFYLKKKMEMMRYFFSLAETSLIKESKNKSNINEKKNCNNPIKKLKKNEKEKKKIFKNNNKSNHSLKKTMSIIISPKKKSDEKVKIEEQKKIGMKITYRDIKHSKECLIDLNAATKKVIHFEKGKNKEKENKNKIKKAKENKKQYSLIKSSIDINKYIEENCEFTDYDEVIEEDKRTFFEYYKDKITDKQIIINTFFVSEDTKPKSIKIALFILSIDLYFLINGLFYSDSYISEKFNSIEKETLFSFIPKSIDRFIYSTMVANIIEFIIKFLIVEENQIRKILLKKKEKKKYRRYEMTQLLKTIFKKINILLFINYIILIFSWYYISCFNNVYHNLKIEWFISSLLIIIIVQILPFILGFLETSLRFISIKLESEKLFKLSLLFP